MGKKKRLNRFIRKWIKSDLPDDRSPKVLLLGVTRIPTSPSPVRRPCSLPLCPSPGVNNNSLHHPLNQDVLFSTEPRRNSFVNRRNLVSRNFSSKKQTGDRNLNAFTSSDIQVERDTREWASQLLKSDQYQNTQEGLDRHESCSHNQKSAQEELPRLVLLPDHWPNAQEVLPGYDSAGDCRQSTPFTVICSPDNFECVCYIGSGDTATPSCIIPNEPLSLPEPVMDRSVDSIGTCSLDVEASADLSDWSEVSSVGTLRSASILTPLPEPHLPSYLSLACTVNGYCTTTNYDPVRLAKSRDASPHRPNEKDHLTPKSYSVYSVHNNLLSPPNIVPLPTQFRSVTSNKMSAEDTLTQHHHSEYYSSSKTMTVMKETHFSSTLFSQDTVDKCIENGHHSLETKIINYNNKSTMLSSEQKKSASESTTIKQEWKQESETKSFIKQRIERLYGPGALAQVVFRLNRQKSRNSESERESTEKSTTQMTSDKPSSDASESIMKQSTSSPTLPVLRHLRPEFRAQLPIINPRKLSDNIMQKSSTVPTLKDKVKINGHSKIQEVATAVPVPEIKSTEIKAVIKESGEKNGHYFLKILDGETKRLLKLADQTEAELSTEGLTEDVIGKLRSASGKARLLVSQKMQQFRGLCTNNITQAVEEAFPTTNEDLQGFWDMVMLQVDQVNTLFTEIEELKANDWQEVKPIDIVDVKPINGSSSKPKKLSTRPRQVTAANEEARRQREAQRKKMIEDRRKAIKSQNKQKESIEIFVPENS